MIRALAPLIASPGRTWTRLITPLRHVVRSHFNISNKVIYTTLSGELDRVN
jgi:hypothetical protein